MSTMENYRVDTDCLRVVWDNDSETKYDFMWLRDNCSCEKCGPHDQGSRFQKLLDISEDIAPRKLQFQRGELSITWNFDDHQSTYDADFLHSFAMRREHVPETRRYWDGQLRQWPRVVWRDVTSSASARLNVFEAVSEFGFCLVDGLGTDRDAIEALANELGYIRETHYGRIFDLFTREKPSIVADLGVGLLPHTDEAYRPVSTGINIFHCIRAGATGGESELVDAHGVALTLQDENPHHFEMLTRVPIRHVRRIEREIIIAEVPAIMLDRTGAIAEVRLNERTMSLINAENGEMRELYAAVRSMLKIAYRENMRIRHRLQPGEALLFDNLRVLHGRTGYTGSRWFRQTQVIRDEFYARMLALQARSKATASVSEEAR